MNKITYQCFGITGLILMFYGFLALAFTQVTSYFFWTILILGGALTVTFVITSLSVAWQKAVAVFTGANILWILLMVYKSSKILEKLGEKSWYVPAILGLAVLLNVAVVYFFRPLLQGASKKQGSSAIFYSITVIAIIAVLNVLSNDQHKQWDLTENKVGELAEQTVSILKNLKSPLHLTAFLDERNPNKGMIKDLLSKYRYVSKNIETKVVDPDRDNKLAVQNKVKDGDLLVEYSGQKNVISDVSEESVTQAIIKVSKRSNPKVCFTKGHGEADIEGPDTDSRSLSGVKNGLVNEGYQVTSITSITENVPADCELVVIAGPISPFVKEEAEAFDRFLEKGGKAVVMLDPNISDPKFSPTIRILDTGLEKVLEKWGVKLGKNIILEKHLQILQGMVIEPTVLAQNYGDHPIVDPFKGMMTAFHSVRSVQKEPQFKGIAVELITSAGGGQSWAETDVGKILKSGKADPDGADIKGPVPIALAAQKENTKLVVYGDSDFATNGMIKSREMNYDLFLNSLSWMQGEVEKISIRPKRLRTSTIELTPEQSMTILNIVLIGIPMLVLTFGMNLWWWRKRRG